MKIHHLAYAVKSIEKSKKSFELLGYVEVQTAFTDVERGVCISFMKHQESKLLIELIEPAAVENPISNYLQKMRGMATPYHICYEVGNLETAIAEFMEQGFVVTAEPAPAPAIDGRNVVFLMNRAAGLIELVENLC